MAPFILQEMGVFPSYGAKPSLIAFFVVHVSYYRNVLLISEMGLAPSRFTRMG
jgi:hypothetical protein